MTIPQVPQFKKCYLKFEFPTYDSLPQKTKNIINKIMKTAVDWNTKVINNQVQTYLTTKGRYIPYQDFWLSCTDDSDENIYYYIDLDKYYDDSWDTDHDLMTNEIIDLNLYSYNNSNDEVKEIAPVKIKAFVDGVLTPMAEFRPVLSFDSYGSSLYSEFELAIKSSNRDEITEEFPEFIDHRHIPELAKNGHLVMINSPSGYDLEENYVLCDIITHSYQSIEAVYVPIRQEEGVTPNKLAKLNNFTLTVQSDKAVLTDEDNEVIDDPYYIIINPQNLQVYGAPVQLVTGKFIIDATNYGGSSSPFSQLIHASIDNCGYHQFNDTSYDSTGTVIEHSFPEHQIHNALSDISHESHNTFVNFNTYYLFDLFGGGELRFFIDNGTTQKQYNILGIKEIGDYDGYASESYFDKDDGTYLLLVNYDNNGYGQTSRTTITAWVVETQPLPPAI